MVIGDMVIHWRYGRGNVVWIDDLDPDTMAVEFYGGIVKEISYNDCRNLTETIKESWDDHVRRSDDSKR